MSSLLSPLSTNNPAALSNLAFIDFTLSNALLTSSLVAFPCLSIIAVTSCVIDWICWLFLSNSWLYLSILLGVLLSVDTFFNPSTCVDKSAFSSGVAAVIKAPCFFRSDESAFL